MRFATSLLVFSLLTVPLHATTYVVPEDAYLVSAAEAIVRGTVIGTHVRLGERIEAVTEIAAEEWIKGDEGAVISIVHPGGVAGAPAFSPGDRVLLFLERNGRGEWTTWALALGAFRFDAGGMLLRAAEVSGWTAGGERHVERSRQGREFVDYVRAIARGEQPVASYFTDRGTAVIRPNAMVPSVSYAWRGANGPFRRSDARVAWRLTGSAGDLNLIEAVDVGIAAWNAASSRIAFERSAAPPSDDRPVDDGEARIIANDPHGDVPSKCCIGVLAITFWRDHGTHQFGDQTYATITDADIVLNDGMSSANFTQASLNDVVTHEMGHALGLRHADRSQTDGPCGGDSNCCMNTHEGGNCAAVMNSQLLFNKEPELQAWDRDAVACLYDGNCATTCTAPSFLQPPLNRVVYRGLTAALSTTVRGTPPLEMQWYRGLTGDRSTPVATGWQYVFTPEESAEYWVHASGTCGDTIESGTATVTVVDCPDVTITSASATLVGTDQVKLRVTAAGGGSVRYRWFRRNASGAPATLIAIVQELTTRRVEGATYFVEVENPCGNSATSAVLTPSETPPPARRRGSRH